MTDLNDMFKAGALNDKHQKLAEKVRDYLLKKANQYRTEADKAVELKNFEMSHTDNGLTFLVIETGMVGDEGSMAAVFCRDYRHIMIGRKGGLTLMNAKVRYKDNRGFWNVCHRQTR